MCLCACKCECVCVCVCVCERERERERERGGMCVFDLPLLLSAFFSFILSVGMRIAPPTAATSTPKIVHIHF